MCRLAEWVSGVFVRVRYSERGQTLAEYASIIAILSVGAVVALGFLSGKVNNLFNKTGNSVNAVLVGGSGSNANNNSNNDTDQNDNNQNDENDNGGGNNGGHGGH